MKIHLVLLLIFFLPAFAFSQTAAEMDNLMETNAVTVGVAARFTLGAAGLTAPELSGAQAVNTAYNEALSRGWVKKAQDDAITMQELAFLMMNVFELKGGIVYSAVRNPRYAYREMIYRKLIQGRKDANMKLSGERFLQILSSTLIYSGEQEEMDAIIHTGRAIK